LLEEEEVDVRVRYSFPLDMEFVYKPESIPDVLQWVENEGHEIIYIYGEVDPWTAGQVQLTGPADALKVIQPGADHGVKILDLDQRDLVLETLEGWLGFGIGTPMAAPFLRVPAEAALFGTPDDPALSPWYSGSFHPS